MRNQARPSEVRRLAAPLGRLLDAGWRRMHWWVATMAVLYVASGTTVVRSDEVAIVLRWGRLVGTTPAVREHGPGLLLAFPRPVDRVVRIPAKRVWEVRVSALAAAIIGDDSPSSSTLDPTTQGYAVTGDRNIVHADIVARYRIRDAAEWAFYGPSAEDTVRLEVAAAVQQSIGEMQVDRVLSDGRTELVAAATRRAQSALDGAGSGLELTSVELTRLGPPAALMSDFSAVQSAFIAAETQRKDAQAFAEATIPGAQAAADAALQSARGTADTARAAARGDVSSFVALEREYRADPVVVRERLYRDAVERAFAGAGALRWIPPPAGQRYNGLRLEVQTGAHP